MPQMSKAEKNNNNSTAPPRIDHYCTKLPSPYPVQFSYKMAAVHATASSILSSFIPRLSAPAASAVTRSATVFSRQLSLPVLPSISFAIPSAIHLNVPALLGDLWESVLRAVPKKKTSHMKKRSRFMAGKGMKDVTALNRCSACGHLKRAHLLCPYCVKGKLRHVLQEKKRLSDEFIQRSKTCSEQR
jgi:large subunit ribosomal protein L32